MKNRSIAMVSVFVAFSLGNVACLKAKPDRQKPDPGPEASTLVANGDEGSQLRAALAPGQVQAPCDDAVKKFAAAIDSIAKLEMAKRTVDATLVAFEDAYSELNDQTVSLTVSGSLSSDQKVKDEVTACAKSRDQAIDAAFSRKELYEAISAAVSAKAPDGDEKRLASVLMKRFEEKSSDLKDKYRQLHELEAKFEGYLQNDVKTSLSSIADSDARKTEFIKRMTRGAADRAKVLPDILKLRNDIATARKKKSWSDLEASEGMPKDAVTVAKRLLDLQEKLVQKLADQKAILAKYAAEHPELKVKEVNPWDVDFLMDKYFAADSGGSPGSAKDTFDRDAVLAAVMQAVSSTFGLKIDEVKDAKPIADSVKHYSVTSDKATIGSFYLAIGDKMPAVSDAQPPEDASSATKLRVVTLSTAHAAGKAQGASAILTGRLGSTLTLSDVGLVLRESGRLLQHLFYNGKYASLSARAESQDYREIAPRTIENWISEPTILTLVAKLSSDQAEKLTRARLFKMTYRLANYLFAARVDLELNGEGSKGDLAGLVDRIYNEVYGVKLEQPATAISGLNGTLWVRPWSEAYAADLYTAFAGKPTDPAVGKRFRDLLAKGATVDPDTAIHDFLGRDAAPADGLAALLKR